MTRLLWASAISASLWICWMTSRLGVKRFVISVASQPQKQHVLVGDHNTHVAWMPPRCVALLKKLLVEEEPQYSRAWSNVWQPERHSQWFWFLHLLVHIVWQQCQSAQRQNHTSFSMSPSGLPPTFSDFPLALYLSLNSLLRSPSLLFPSLSQRYFFALKICPNLLRHLDCCCCSMPCSKGVPFPC